MTRPSCSTASRLFNCYSRLQSSSAKLRGKDLALFLVVEAADGYKAVFALPELDPAFNDRTIIVAETRDSKPLAAAEGRWRVVVPDEKRHGRWVRQVVSLNVRRA